jgi:hypothetical protein
MKLQLLSTERGMKSRSLKALAQEMSIRLGYKVFRTTTQRANKVQFRYGSQVNKLDQYKWFKEKGLSSLVFTTNRAEAQAWVNQGITVFGRKTLNGSNGAGIEIYDATNPNVGQCLVYTQYKKKKRESWRSGRRVTTKVRPILVCAISPTVMCSARRWN